MQYSKSPTISRLFRPASLFCAGFFVLAPLTAAVAVAGQQQVAVNTAATAPFAATPATTPAKAPASDIARWSDTVWNAARSGDLETVEKALKEVPESHAVDESKRLREIVAARASHVDAGAKTRDADRAKALEEIKTELGKNEVTKALTAAVKFQTLSDDMASALKVSEIQDVVKAAEAANPVAEEKGDWLVAQEILFRLRTLHELSDGAVFRSYDAKLDEVNKRIMLLAQYAPRELYRLRRELALRLDPEKPFPEFNEAFAEDWKEALDGISKGMLASALSTAANEHISGGGWEPLIKGGLNAVRVLATTPALKENFPGIADPAKAQTLVDAVTRNVEGLARMDRDAIGKPQFNAAIRDIMEANQKGPDLPLTVVFREFGDGALEELAGRFEDEYSQVIWPEQLRRFEQMVKGNFVGVGIMIRHDDRRDIQVINPLEGGPAFRSGVEPDDRITAVDGKSTVGWTLNKAVDSITGPAGEDVTLTIKREGAEQPVDIKLTREEIKIRSVTPVVTSSSTFGRAFGSASAFAFFCSITSAFWRSMVDFSNAFVEDGKIVAGQDRMGRQVWQMKAQPQAAIYKDLPLVVLVNQGSASASEIVSGCLKAHDRAVVIGDRSFGKGSVQTVHPCGDGRADAQLKLTTQYYVLPPGPGETEPRLVHKRPGTLDWGVLPDLVVKMTPDQIEKSTMLRQNADVIEQKKAKADAEPKARPNVEELVTTGVDPQLELALLVLQARSLKELDAAAQAAAVDSKKSDQSGG